VRVVYLEWLDSESDHGWHETARVQEKRVLLAVRSVGFLICEDGESVTITTSVSPHEVNDPLTIPKVAIVKRRAVKVP
jgi:hypothetical protein